MVGWRVHLCLPRGIEELNRLPRFAGPGIDISFTTRRDEDANPVVRRERAAFGLDADEIIVGTIGGQVGQDDALARVAALFGPARSRPRHLLHLARADDPPERVLDIEIEILCRARVFFLAVIVPGQRYGDSVFVEQVTKS